jgi:hypothetical protein
MYHIQHCFIYGPSDSTVSEDAGIEPSILKTVDIDILMESLTLVLSKS